MYSFLWAIHKHKLVVRNYSFHHIHDEKHTENQTRTQYSTGGDDILIDTWGCYCSAFGLNVILSERQPRVKRHPHITRTWKQETRQKITNSSFGLWLIDWLNLKVNVNITSSCVLWVWWLSIWSCWQWESTKGSQPMMSRVVSAGWCHHAPGWPSHELLTLHLTGWGLHRRVRLSAQSKHIFCTPARAHGHSKNTLRPHAFLSMPHSHGASLLLGVSSWAALGL